MSFRPVRQRSAEIRGRKSYVRVWKGDLQQVPNLTASGLSALAREYTMPNPGMVFKG